MGKPEGLLPVVHNNLFNNFIITLHPRKGSRFGYASFKG